ncbi:hypothetical protein Nepgr_026484 [Nepenthes gracilis]|uniref:Uncharacterized protein n=1 Tax=Nepenthes gracilis TaxID=150966 RepID=A0AAD3T8N6_NEPGR|nr:hypothetical protein Nepgr_026484 [Nepenthes gracilis]
MEDSMWIHKSDMKSNYIDEATAAVLGVGDLSIRDQHDRPVVARTTSNGYYRGSGDKKTQLFKWRWRCYGRLNPHGNVIFSNNSKLRQCHHPCRHCSRRSSTKICGVCLRFELVFRWLMPRMEENEKRSSKLATGSYYS